ncbi:TonB-dependent receptor [Brackiella oedipodis]|uniref:TonB-dependent receptor n=1 Tax=Brackiella oedipodis TaxID=124225 RepID=UPI00048DFAB5|nr:TonB-dependent receptor [Brackiella oedipodis]
MKVSPTQLSLALALGFGTSIAHAQSVTVPSAVESNPANVQTMEAIAVTVAADASKNGLTDEYTGGMVADGSRLGVLGNRSILETPFNTTAYTDTFIRNKMAEGVGDVLKNDASVNVARGFGNFQDAYFIRGFVSGSDDILYNGLYGILPRQYISANIAERVELLRGSSAFLNGMAPGGGNIGGTINLVPKRAGTEPLALFSAGYGAGDRGNFSMDLSRRFADDRLGVRLNVVHDEGHTSVEDEKRHVDLVNLGIDWRGERVRLSADFGWQKDNLDAPRPNVDIAALSDIPDAPNGKTNWAQSWTFSDERDTWGTLRGEFDLLDNVTAYAALGMRNSHEENTLANLTLTDVHGNGTEYRFDNGRRDFVRTGEAGLKGNFMTGAVSHQWVLAYNFFDLKTKNGYAMDWGNSFDVNMYEARKINKVAFSGNELRGASIDDPILTNHEILRSIVFGNTFGFLEDDLLVTLGARWQQIDTQAFDYKGTGTGHYRHSRLSPAATVTFKFTPEWAIYGNYIENLAPGATASSMNNNRPVPNANEMLDPYVSRQKEVGLKYDHGTIGASVAYFHTSEPRAYYNTDNVFTSSGKNKHQGVELNTWGEITEGLRVLGGVTFLNAKQKRTGSALSEGNRQIGIPSTQGKVNLEWDVPRLQGLTLNTSLNMMSGRYADDQNKKRVAGFALWDAGARYVVPVQGHDVTLRVNVENLLNKRYWASVGGYPGSGYLNNGYRRRVSLNASLQW